MTPSYQTGEYWISVVTSIVGLLTTMGYMTVDEADHLTKAITALAGAAVTIASTVAYVVTRVQLKQRVVDALADASVIPHPAVSGDPVTTVSQAAVDAHPTKTFTAADALKTAIDNSGV